TGVLPVPSQVAVPTLVGPGSVRVIRRKGCGGNTHAVGDPHEVIAVSKKLQVTGAAPAGAGPIAPINPAKMAALKVKAASWLISLPKLTILPPLLSLLAGFWFRRVELLKCFL